MLLNRHTFCGGQSDTLSIRWIPDRELRVSSIVSVTKDTWQRWETLFETGNIVDILLPKVCTSKYEATWVILV